MIFPGIYPLLRCPIAAPQCKSMCVLYTTVYSENATYDVQANVQYVQHISACFRALKRRRGQSLFLNVIRATVAFKRNGY